MMMPHPENIQAGGHSFGFNGMESDDELYGNQNSYTTKFRQYDARVGRWFSTDPKAAKYPSQSPYNFSFNNPIALNDPRGDDPGGDDTKTHEVEDGNTVSGIADKYGVSVDDIVEWNPDITEDNKDVIHPDDEINVEDPEDNVGGGNDKGPAGQDKNEDPMEIPDVTSKKDQIEEESRMHQRGMEGSGGDEEKPTLGIPGRDAGGRPVEEPQEGWLDPVFIRSPWIYNPSPGAKKRSDEKSEPDSVVDYKVILRKPFPARRETLELEREQAVPGLDTLKKPIDYKDPVNPED